jgi:hypothetical protein
MIEYEILRKKGDEPNVPAVILAADSPATVAALIAYADAAQRLGADPSEVTMARAKAQEFEAWRAEHLARPSDPAATPT